MAPFWHRYADFSILNLSVFHLADKCFTITNLINLRIILFLEYRKTRRTEVLRVSYVWTQRYLTITNLYSDCITR